MTVAAQLVLVIGTTNDPATPDNRAVAVHHLLRNSSLLTLHGW